MSKISFFTKIFLIAGLLFTAFAGYKLYDNIQNGPASNIGPVKNYKTTLAKKSDIIKTISFDGQVTPLKDITVSAQIPGNIVEMRVKEGQYVKEGDLLAIIDHDELETGVKQADAAVKQAEAELQKAKNGARPEDVLIAEQSVNAARASLDAARSALASTIRYSYDVIDEQMDVLDKFFTDEDSLEDIELSVHRIKDPAKKNIETMRYELNGKLDALKLAVNNLQSSEDLTDDMVAGSAELESNVLSAIKKIVNSIESAASDELENWPGDNGLVNVQNVMNKIRPIVENERQKLNSAKSNLELAVSKLNSAKANLEKILSGSRKEDILALEANLNLAKAKLEAAKNNLEKAYVHAPVSGTVSEILKEKGEYVGALQALLKIISNGVYVKALVPELDLPKIHEGQKVTLKFDALGGKEFVGTVKYISPSEKEINNITYYESKIFMNPQDIKDNNISPGMSTDVFVDTVLKEDVLTVPNELLKRDEKGFYVYILKAGVPAKQYVQVGARDDKKTEVLSGLTSSDKLLYN